MLDQQQEKVNTLEQQVSSGSRINEPIGRPGQRPAGLESERANVGNGPVFPEYPDRDHLAEPDGFLDVQYEQCADQAPSNWPPRWQTEPIAPVTGRVRPYEVTQLRDQMISLGNTQIAGKYIFGGFVSDQPPFDATGNFNGTDDQVNIQVDQGSYIAINYSGGKLLRGGTPAGSSGTDVIGVLNNLITALNNNDVSGVGSSISGLDSSLNQIQAAQGDVGARENRLQNADNILTSTKDYLTKAVSAKQDS